MTSKQPKTHSDILWHFTGGPKWDSKKNCQMKKLKSNREAFEIAVNIYETKHLRVGGYHELIKVIIPTLKLYSSKLKKLEEFNDYPAIIKTSPVCCLADIPTSELFHHAQRYGKMGIGFRRESVLKEEFNPVFYTLSNTKIANKLYTAQNALSNVEVFYDIESKLDDLLDEIKDNLCEGCEDNYSPSPGDVLYEADELVWEVKDAIEDFKHLMSFVKTFDDSEFDSIYAEREWRSIKPYRFKYNHIEAIVFPTKELLKEFQVNYKPMKKIKLLTFDEIAN